MRACGQPSDLSEESLRGYEGIEAELDGDVVLG